MPSFYYVKAGGSAAGATEDNNDGVYSTAKTGTWASAFSAASEYFDTISAALASAHAVVDGDVICISDASSDTLAGDVADAIPGGVEVLSVSDANVDQYSAASTAQITSAAGGDSYSLYTNFDYSFGNICGVNIETKDASTASVDGSLTRFIDCALYFNSAFRAWNFTGRGSHSEVINSDLSGFIQLNADEASLTVIGGTFSSGNTTPVLVPTRLQNMNFDGCDMSGHTGTEIFEIANSQFVVGNTNFVGCNLPAAWTMANTATSAAASPTIQACDSRYQFIEEGYCGNIEFVTDVYYDSHDTLDDGITKGSFEYEGNGNTSPTNWLHLGVYLRPNTMAIAATNSEAASKTKARLRFVTASGQTLNSKDLVVLVGAPVNGANYRRYWVMHMLAQTETGATLPTETGAWTGAGLGTQYYLDVDMGSPDNGRVIAIPCLCKPNVTVYFSWQLEFVA